jgi:hypothetical protein
LLFLKPQVTHTFCLWAKQAKHRMQTSKMAAKVVLKRGRTTPQRRESQIGSKPKQRHQQRLGMMMDDV